MGQGIFTREALKCSGKPHYLWLEGKYRGASEIGRPVKGGRKILDVSRRGGAKFWTSPEGGRKILDLINFFSMFLKHNFFMFWGYFGHFSFFGPRGAKNFRRVAKGGGRKILDASSRGGRRILDGRSFQIP